MGKLTPKPYRVFRDGSWVWVHPEPVEYKPEPLKSVEVTPNGLLRRIKNKFKRKNK